MKTWLLKTTQLIDSITEGLGRVISWLTLLMVITMFAIVVLRYGFDLGWIAMQESVLYIHGIVFLMGAGYTLKADGHVRVDIFYHKFSRKNKAIIDLLGSLLLLLPVTLFIFFISFEYVEKSWQIMEKSSEAGGLPFVYLGKSLLLVMSVTLTLQGIAEIARNILIISDEKNDENSDHDNTMSESSAIEEAK